MNPGASPDLISAVEASIGFRFPAGFRELYMEINGFADFLIYSHTIGFVKTQPGVFKKYGGGEYFFIAVSFLDAVKLINANSDLIY
ncbi:SMI1/KNR4 family protein [Chitinophaga sp. OAE865]|uniref:SMI1/KNR4 family protein n=1 Tax=Chitinophaga sp. OAE865 TaxID=2817898 RepID=UPI001AE8C30E